jgi:hypothetical protein
MQKIENTKQTKVFWKLLKMFLKSFGLGVYYVVGLPKRNPTSTHIPPQKKLGNVTIFKVQKRHKKEMALLGEVLT